MSAKHAPAPQRASLNTNQTLQASAYEVACDACPVECSYCPTSNPDRVQLCESVMDHTTSSTVDGTLESLLLAPGYWRSSGTSTEIRECYEADACVGGTNGYCGAGYDGPCRFLYLCVCLCNKLLVYACRTHQGVAALSQGVAALSGRRTWYQCPLWCRLHVLL